LGTRLLNHLIYEHESEFDFVRELEDRIILLSERLAYGPSTFAIVDEVERRGIPSSGCIQRAPSFNWAMAAASTASGRR